MAMLKLLKNKKLLVLGAVAAAALLWLSATSSLRDREEREGVERPTTLAPEPVPDDRNLFFIDSPCWATANSTADGGTQDVYEGEVLSRRAACSVEAAAALHPDRPVTVVRTCPLPPDWRPAAAAAHVRAALALRNVRVWAVPLGDDLFADSPLEPWLRSGVLKTSKWPRNGRSDALRLLLLWRYAGTYLDSDLLLIKSLDGLRNFAGTEWAMSVVSAVLDTRVDAAGRRVIDAFLAEFAADYRGDVWGYNGPIGITHVLQRLCRTKQMKQMTAERCGGFTVLPQSSFFAVPSQQWQRLVDERDASATLREVEGSYGVHFWNRFTRGTNVTLHSAQPYAQLARRHCPLVAAAAADFL